MGDTLLVGGNFTQMGGAAHQGIAAIHIPTRTVLPWGVPFNNQIHDIAVDNGVVYVVGTFTTVGGQPRGFGAALSLSTGDLLPWDPGFLACHILRRRKGGACIRWWFVLHHWW